MFEKFCKQSVKNWKGIDLTGETNWSSLFQSSRMKMSKLVEIDLTRSGNHVTLLQSCEFEKLPRLIPEQMSCQNYFNLLVIFHSKSWKTRLFVEFVNFDLKQSNLIDFGFETWSDLGKNIFQIVSWRMKTNFLITFD